MGVAKYGDHQDIRRKDVSIIIEGVWRATRIGGGPHFYSFKFADGHAFLNWT
jgi:hypothetical protein